ncbi:unnamed protein product [Prunus armeniaca]
MAFWALLPPPPPLPPQPEPEWAAGTALRAKESCIVPSAIIRNRSYSNGKQDEAISSRLSMVLFKMRCHEHDHRS